MTRANTNRAIAIQVDKRKGASAASTILATGLSGGYNDDSPAVPVRQIPLNQIQGREINEFDMVNIPQLASSIQEYGLIDPISIVHRSGTGDEYIVVSGHRRLEAYRRLQLSYPGMYSRIPANVYELTDDPQELEQGLPYIDAATEDQLYREANLQSRQLNYAEVARQIRRIIQKFDNKEYYEKVNQFANPSERYEHTKGDRTKMIMSLLAPYNYQGWQRESIRKYIKLYDAVKEGSISMDVLDRIENGDITVNMAYQQSIGRTTNVTATELDKSFKKIDKAVESIRLYRTRVTQEQKTKIRELIAELQSILD